MMTSEEVRELMSRVPVVGRVRSYVERTGSPERLPDHCHHADKDLIVMPDGTVECYACGSRPPGFYTIERNS